MTVRTDGRGPDQLRPLALEPGYLPFADGSVLIALGGRAGLLGQRGAERTTREAGLGGGKRSIQFGRLSVVEASGMPLF